MLGLTLPANPPGNTAALFWGGVIQHIPALSGHLLMRIKAGTLNVSRVQSGDRSSDTVVGIRWPTHNRLILLVLASRAAEVTLKVQNAELTVEL